MTTTRKYALSLSLTVCSLWVITAAVSAAPYVSSKGYQLNAPDGWTVASNYQAADVALIAPPVNGLTSNVNVTITAALPATSAQILAQFETIRAQYDTLYARSWPGSRILAQARETVDGSPALDTTLTFNQATASSSMVLLRMRQAVVFRPGTVFVFTFITSDAQHANYDALFDGIINSVRWTNSAEQTALAPTMFHSTKGYDLAIPAGWQAEPSQLDGIDLSLVQPVLIGHPSKLTITVKPNLDGETLEYIQKGMNVLMPQAVSHYSVVWQGYFMLDGVRALATKSTAVSNYGESILMRQVEVHRLGMRYSITFGVSASSHADTDAVFEAMIKSFHWTH